MKTQYTRAEIQAKAVDLLKRFENIGARDDLEMARVYAEIAKGMEGPSRIYANTPTL